MARLSAETVAWRGAVADSEVETLAAAAGWSAERGWWDRVRPQSLGWVVARDRNGELISFLNVAWDGAQHAFLLDVQVHPHGRRRGLGARMVALAAESARAAGCVWLHVDYEPNLAEFYEQACGFRPTAAGLIRLGDTVSGVGQ